MIKKKALITGIAGQDGAFLSKLLLEKNYKVFGIIRSKNKTNLWRLEKLKIKNKIKLKKIDLSNYKVVLKLIKKEQFDEIYNLASNSSVAESFKNPRKYLVNNSEVVINILESIRLISNKTKFFQVSSSEMYGNNFQKKIDLKSKPNPINPYAVSKLNSQNITQIYRLNYKIFAVCGICFNHESSLRDEKYVSKKIVSFFKNCKKKNNSKLTIGNILKKRDWGSPIDYVKAFWLSLQQKKPEDYIMCTGQFYSIKKFIEIAANFVNIKISWKGKYPNLIGYDQNYNKIIQCTKKFERKFDTKDFTGNHKLTKKKLKWRVEYNIKDIIREMFEN
jgi:GDPmannose 4,6-dehydratase